jgi:hypothetical protein
LDAVKGILLYEYLLERKTCTGWKIILSLWFQNDEKAKETIRAWVITNPEEIIDEFEL